jgi:hypothetical protein
MVGSGVRDHGVDEVGAYQKHLPIPFVFSKRPSERSGQHVPVRRYSGY